MLPRVGGDKEEVQIPQLKSTTDISFPMKTDRPFATVDRYGILYARALHVVERYRLLDYEAAKEEQERGEKKEFPTPSTRVGTGLEL
jgi:hypothetical protein